MRMGAPMRIEVVMEDPMEMVIQITIVIQMGLEIQMEMGNHPGERKNLLDEMENQVEVVGDQTLVMMMGVEVGPSLPQQILHHLEEEGIGGPDFFLCDTMTPRTSRSNGTTWTSW